LPEDFDYEKSDSYSLGMTLLISLGVQESALQNIRKDTEENYEHDILNVYSEINQIFVDLLKKMTCFNHKID